MIVVYINDNWTLTISNDGTSTTGTGNITRPITSTSTHRWLAESTALVPCSPPDYHNPDVHWNAEKKRREITGIRAAQRKHEIAKYSACKITRKVLKYYREPNIRKEVIISQANESSAGKRAKASSSTRRKRKR
jgi:hypothetical protein